MIVLAIFNAGIRESTYGKVVSELRAHQISTLTGIVLFGLYIGAIARWWGFESMKQAIAVGVLWLVLTIAFEFLFGRYAMQHSWQKLLSDYNLLAGRVWVLVLLWIAIAPTVFYRWLR